jgi:hypothetical protein
MRVMQLHISLEFDEFFAPCGHAQIGEKLSTRCV